MPKDLTKLSPKEFEVLSGAALENRFRWEGGSLELIVSEAPLPEPLPRD